MRKPSTENQRRREEQNDCATRRLGDRATAMRDGRCVTLSPGLQVLFFSVVLCLCAGFCFSVMAAADDQAMAKKLYVSVAPVNPVTVAPGKSAPVELDFRVEQGFHINSNKPKDSLLVATSIKLNPPTNIMVGKVSYPAGEDMGFEFLGDEKLNVYTGDFRVTALVTPAGTVSPGTYRVHGVLKYQACDNRQCYAPKEQPVEFDVKVQKPASKHVGQNPGQSPHVHQ